jgi:hypothetical protein
MSHTALRIGATSSPPGKAARHHHHLVQYALVLAHHHRPDLEMPHLFPFSSGQAIQELACLVAELTDRLLLDAVGEHAGHEVARQSLGRVLSGQPSPERPQFVEAKRVDAIELGIERSGGRRCHRLPRLILAHGL